MGILIFGGIVAGVLGCSMAYFVTLFGLAAACFGGWIFFTIYDPLVWTVSAILVLGGVSLIGQGALIDLAKRRAKGNE